MRVLATALAVTLVGLTVQANAQEITGAGGTFPAPVYLKWGELAKAAAGITLNYQAIGSGGGQSQILARTVDFGATDAPMDPAKIAAGDLFQFPTVIGAVVVIVNIPGIEANQLKLSGPVLADIYAGNITKWNDDKIKALNPGLDLPRMAISTVHRGDGSGTTFVFTSYLSAVSAEWKDKTGANTSVNWPNGDGSKGNDGVAASVSATKGAIGYVEYAFASQNHLVTVELQNHDGKMVAPTMASFAAGAANADWAHAQNYAVNLVNQPGAATWPILSTTFIELPKTPKDAARGAAVIKFFDWSYSNGDAAASALQYIPLPAAVKDSVRAAWKHEIKS